MKNMIRTCLVILVLLTLYYTFQEPKQSPIVEREENKQPIPEEGREIDRFDWKQNKYIYKDEVEPDPVYPPLQRELEYMPDVAVWGETSPQPSQEIQYIKVDGKTYRVYKEPNGTIKLKEFR